MDNSTSNLFVNDGSFLERFKQLQQQQQQQQQASAVAVTDDGSVYQQQPQDLQPSEENYAGKPPSEIAKSGFSLKKNGFVSSAAPNDKSSSQHTKPPSSSSAPSSNGKLAFSLRPKSRSIINPLKLGDDDEEDEENNEEKAEFYSERSDADLHQRGKRNTSGSNQSSAARKKDSIPAPPSDLEVKKVADKLALFVAKNGRQFEDLTRRKNSDNPLFRFLFDRESSEYKYYDYCVTIEERALGTEVNGSGGSVTTSQSSQHSPRRGSQSSSYQMPPSALYGSTESQSTGSLDSVSMMEFYMKKAAAEDMRKPHKRSRDEMPPPASLNTTPPMKKGHHMGDYIPQEELEKFLAKCNSQQHTGETERVKIQPDNVGHRLLSKMGWKEGEGLGSGKGGRADPVEAGSVKVNNLGVGAAQPGEVSAEDDIYEQYKKRMMLGYRYRPNPLNNPRKAYY